MRVGISVPQFNERAAPALDITRRAEDAGLDGVFVFDHLWPMGQPTRPALHSYELLGALAATTTTITLGTLVARVSLLANPVLVHNLVTLNRMLERPERPSEREARPSEREARTSERRTSRFVAAIGTGDHANRAENEAYGIEYGSVADRVSELIGCCRELRAAGVHTWVGGRSAAVRRAAAEEADGWNGWGWGADTAAFADAATKVTNIAPAAELSWGGQVLVARTPEEADAKLARAGDRDGLVHGKVEDLAAHFAALDQAGAAWAICAPIDVGADPESVELVAEAALLARAAERGRPAR